MRVRRNGSCSERFRVLRRRLVLAMGIGLAAPRVVMAAAVRRIGILGDTPGPQWDVFRKALADLGYIEGGNMALEARYSRGDSSQFPGLAVELVQRGVEVIVAEG